MSKLETSIHCRVEENGREFNVYLVTYEIDKGCFELQPEFPEHYYGWVMNPNRRSYVQRLSDFGKIKLLEIAKRKTAKSGQKLIEIIHTHTEPAGWGGP